MENASKALIIAGAILLSILIIALGVFVFNQAKGAMNNVNMKDQEVSAFNSKFESYEGTAVSGSQVKSLIDTVRAHNNSYSDDVSKQVNIQNAAAANTGDRTTAVNANYSNLKGGVNTGRTYTVTIVYNAHTGYVSEVGYVVN